MSYTTVTLLLKQRPHFDTAHGYIIYDAMRKDIEQLYYILIIMNIY